MTSVPSQALKIPKSGDENSFFQNQSNLLQDRCQGFEEENGTLRGKLSTFQKNPCQKQYW